MLNAIRYAQKLAVATGCGVRIVVASNSYLLTRKGTASSTCSTGSAYSLAVRGEGSYSGSEEGVSLISTVSSFNSRHC